jgi:hypothetical protein
MPGVPFCTGRHRPIPLDCGVPTPLFALPLTVAKCPACHFAKACVVYRKVSTQHLFCPRCQHAWDRPSKPPALEEFSLSWQEEIEARLDRIKGLCRALAQGPGTSTRSKVLAAAIHRESAAYLALVDAQRGVDRKDDDRT